MALALRYAARSDPGLIRDINEDSGYAGPRLLVVADGVGGHAAGEVASSVAVAVLSALDEDSPGRELLERLAGAVQNANSHLRDMVAGDPDLKGMGTTLTGLLRAGSRFGLVHVGDSRCYLLRAGEMQQITRDHTFVQGLVDEGRITAEEAGHHPQRNLITNSLDGRDEVALDLSVREARPGDRYLLCSDGLSGVVSADTLSETLQDEASAEAAVERLVDLALKSGGPDNVTAIVADVVEVETRPPSAVPVRVGAAAVGDVRRNPANTPAGKAAALRPPPEPPTDDQHVEDQPPRRVRRLLLLLVLLALVAGGLYGGWRWSQMQYYVGAQGQNVAIFRGLSQDVGPVSTSRLYREVDVALADLPAYQRARVKADIAASGLAGADRIVSRLRAQAAVCRAQAAASDRPTPTPSASPATTDQPTGTPTPTETPTGTPTPSATPSPTASPTGTPDLGVRDCGEGS